MQPTPSILAPEIGDRYAIERELGRGGTALVYLARDRESGTTVALKILRAELVESVSAERFLREIRVTQQFAHPNIVPVLGSGVAGGAVYCVLAYMDGGTLRDRLHREKQLPLSDAAAVARAVGAALAYAHAQRIIHRDVKPENILFGGGNIWLADFGIARALEHAGDVTTSTGIVRGTPAYMSPEQASGEREYDGRSDLYSLACSLYESIAGTPAFVGANSQAVLAQRLIHTPRPLRVYRPTATPELEAVLARALAIAPADRYQTVTEFTAAFCAAIESPGATAAATAPGNGASHRAWPWLLVALGVAVFAAVDGPLAGRMPWYQAAVLDTTRYAVLPFDHAADVPPGLNEGPLLEDAVLRWSGISLGDRARTIAALQSLPTGALAPAVAARIARGSGAGRFFAGDIGRDADSLRLHLALYDAAANGALLAEATTRFAPTAAALRGAIQRLTDGVLVRDSRYDPADSAGTRSLPALQSWLRGQRALDVWQLADADSAFARAVDRDPAFASASLWLALVRRWHDAPAANWKAPLMRAANRASTFTPRDSVIADALQAEADNDWPHAAAVWRARTVTSPGDFVAWFGLASCLRRDHAVLADHNSRSGWRFRASAEETVAAYSKAFELRPATQYDVFELARELLYTQTDQRRIGMTEPGGVQMLAEPGWAGDTLTFIPYPESAWAGDTTVDRHSTRRSALLKERHRLFELSTSWVAATPGDPSALDALALSLRLLDDPAALDTLRRARAVATDRSERVRLAAHEIWFRLAAAVPSDTAELERIRSLGDSLLAQPDLRDAAVLYSVAALLGRPAQAALLGGAGGTSREAPTIRSLTRDAPALLAYAAFGGPADTVRRLESAVTTAIRATVLEDDRQRIQQQWLDRAARIAFPDVAFSGLPALAKEGDPLLAADDAVTRGDRAPARRYLDALPGLRTNFVPEELAPEALYSEARLLLVLGDSARAATWIEPMLTAAARIDPDVLAQLPNAVAFVRCIILRADLAAHAGDLASAARWARAAAILWRHADPFLRSTVGRMERLAASPTRTASRSR